MFASGTFEILLMVSQLNPVGWLVAASSDRDAIDVDVVNMNVLVTNIVRNSDLNWLTVVTNQLAWNY